MADSLLQPRRGDDEEGSYLASVSDLMVGMLFVFIIMLMAFALSFRVAEDEATQVQWRLADERDVLGRERDTLASERDTLAGERDSAGERARPAGPGTRPAGGRARPAGPRARRARRGDRPPAAQRAHPQRHAGRRGGAAARAPRRGQPRSRERHPAAAGEPAVRQRAGGAAPRGRARAARARGGAGAQPALLQPCAGIQQADCPVAAKPLLEAVLVEGHTDDVPIGTPQFEDNWELASARAINTYKALSSYEPSLAALKNARGEDLLGVSGYEAHRPVSLAATPDGRRLNRRIDLRFLIAAPSADELTTLRGAVAPCRWRGAYRPAVAACAGRRPLGGRPAGRPPRVPSHQCNAGDAVESPVAPTNVAHQKLTFWQCSSREISPAS